MEVGEERAEEEGGGGGRGRKRGRSGIQGIWERAGFPCRMCIELHTSACVHVAIREMYTHVHVHVQVHVCTCTCTCVYMFTSVYGARAHGSSKAGSKKSTGSSCLTHVRVRLLVCFRACDSVIEVYQSGQGNTANTT